jgi:hypothetical protein
MPDGTVIWTSPTGEVHRTVPGGLDLFPDMAPSHACRGPNPVRRNRSREQAVRIARIRIRNRIHRPINEAHRRLERAYCRENHLPQRPQPDAQDAVHPQGQTRHQPIAHGSTTRSNPKNYHLIGGLLPKHRSQTTHRSDDARITGSRASRVASKPRRPRWLTISLRIWLT